MSVQIGEKARYCGKGDSMSYHRLGQTVMSYRKKKRMTIREFADYPGIILSGG
ncbi:hypothetical protein [Desulfosporosinus sp. SB140]|uniref:hypothetical protein n=1 Tax=Desulfosporosinus paludis TaxID=3115649 RepID=UPI00388E06CC